MGNKKPRVFMKFYELLMDFNEMCTAMNEFYFMFFMCHVLKVNILFLGF